MSFMIGCGATTQLTRQPIMRSSLDAEPTVMVRETRPGCAPGCTGRLSPKTSWSIAASLRAGVVPVAGHGADVLGYGLPQHAMALERQVAVGVIVFYCGTGDLPGDRGRREISVEVLQPEEIRVPGGVGGIADLVHADSRDVRQARDGHENSSCQWAVQSWGYYTGRIFQ
jgi:hypothetical protein